MPPYRGEFAPLSHLLQSGVINTQTGLLMTGNFQALIKAINPFRPRMSNHPCWICGARVEFHPDDIQRVNHQCTLGRGMSFTACEECHAKRGSTPDELANVIVRARTNMSCLPAEGDWELTEAQWAEVETELGFFDAHGTKHGQPVNFSRGGRYYTIKEWRQTEGYLEELGRAKERYKDWWMKNTSSEAVASKV